MDQAPSPAPNTGQTLEQLAAAQPSAPTPAPTKRFVSRPDMFSKFLVLEGFSHWFFRLGFASIFLINAVYATVDPDSFTVMLEKNPIASAIGFTDLMLKIALVNDLLLGVFIIGGWRKQLVYAWAGAWLLLVAGLKMMNLFF